MQDLTVSLQKVGSAVYGQGAAGEGGQGAAAGQRPDEGTVEGEFREV
jgi:hypothetical protein